MKRSKVIVLIVILIIGVWFVESVAMPFYYFLFANVNVVKHSTGASVCANVTKEELENYPALENAINGKGCSGTLCVVTQDEWSKIHNFTDNIRRNDPNGKCFRFETYDGVYNIETIRP